MNKAELIEALADKTGLQKQEAISMDIGNRHL